MLPLAIPVEVRRGFILFWLACDLVVISLDFEMVDVVVGGGLIGVVVIYATFVLMFSVLVQAARELLKVAVDLTIVVGVVSGKLAFPIKLLVGDMSLSKPPK